MLRQAFRLLDEGVLVIDSAGAVISVNPAACALLDRTEQELRTPNYLLELDVRTEAGVSVPGQRSFGTEALATGNPVREVTVSAAKRDGSRVWLSLNYQPLTRADSGAVDGLVVSMRGHAPSAKRGSGRARVSPQTSEHPLTNREQDVIGLIALGRETAQIAKELEISPETVRTHVRNAMSKLGAHSRAQLVALTLSSDTRPGLTPRAH